MDNSPIPSPCISQCCLDSEDICVGCKRHIDEITGWHGANEETRRQILQRCCERGNTHIAPLD